MCFRAARLLPLLLPAACHSARRVHAPLPPERRAGSGAARALSALASGAAERSRTLGVRVNSREKSRGANWERKREGKGNEKKDGVAPLNEHFRPPNILNRRPLPAPSPSRRRRRRRRSSHRSGLRGGRGRPIGQRKQRRALQVPTLGNARKKRTAPGCWMDRGGRGQWRRLGDDAAKQPATPHTKLREPTLGPVSAACSKLGSGSQSQLATRARHAHRVARRPAAGAARATARLKSRLQVPAAQPANAARLAQRPKRAPLRNR